MIPLRDYPASQRFPAVNYGFIAISVMVFLLELTGGFSPEIFARYGVVPSALAGGFFPGFYRFVTSIFIHADVWHLAGNLLFLWVFGEHIEEFLGYVRYMIFFIAAGTAGGLLHCLFYPQSMIPLIGASGAISGVMALYMLYFPKMKISILLLFVFLVRIPAIVFISIWILFQIWNGWMTLRMPETGGTAYLAHIGGIVYGFVFAMFWGTKIRKRWLKRMSRKGKNRNI
jgi:membrane associated rhomboid family serine protease